MSERLSHRWNRPQSKVIGWLLARIKIAIIRASSSVVTRGTTSATLIGFEDDTEIQKYFKKLFMFLFLCNFIKKEITLSWFKKGREG